MMEWKLWSHSPWKKGTKKLHRVCIGSLMSFRKKEEELIGYSAILNLNHGALYYSKRCMLAYLYFYISHISIIEKSD